MNRLTITIFTPQELNHSSYVQTGLFELERENYLKTIVKCSFSKRLGTLRIQDEQLEETKQPHPKTSFYQLTDKSSGNKISFATDLYDASFSFSKYALDNCDYVFKRNYETHYIEQLPKKYQKKLYPLGLTFGCHSKFKKNWNLFYLGFFITNLKLNFKIDSYFYERLTKAFTFINNHWRFINTSRVIGDFESLSTIKNKDVLFQTRCFSEEKKQDVIQIHQQRFRIIRMLKERFKNQFKGGFISSDIVLKKYKDSITNLPIDPTSYLELVKKAKVVIYTRGLVNSPAWKMAEYISQGKVIIAEKLTAELPVPLQHGKEVLFFENEAEIIPLIEKVLADDELSAQLSKNARLYFEKNVHPKHNMQRIIDFMINDMKGL